MKSMLYVGATLMIGASIYGFVDYNQNQEKKEFKEMYRAVTHEPVKMKVPAEVSISKADVAEKKTEAARTAVKSSKQKKNKSARSGRSAKMRSLLPAPSKLKKLK